MTITDFLGLFSTVKPTKKGWDVNCPAHDDKHPSLGVMEGEEGRIVLNCLAHCSTDSICRALGIEIRDLFADRPRPQGRVMLKAPPIRQRTPEGMAFAFDLHALDLHQYADKILAAAVCEECVTWTDEELALALACVTRAYAAQDRADWCEDYADHIRYREGNQ